jgi:uncharacterized protein (TIGR02145 family)
MLLTILGIYTSCFSQQNASSKEAILIKKLETAFTNSLNKVETSDRTCWLVKSLIGDLNLDGASDGIVFFGCGFRDGGNAIAGSGLAIFLNKNGELLFSGIDESNDKFIPNKISAGLIYGETRDYSPDDPRCCPSIIKKVTLKYSELILSDNNMTGNQNIVSNNLFGSFKDSRDGRAYKSVKIGNQVWMAENLSADKFRNGDKIPRVTDRIKWYNSNEAYFNSNVAKDQPAWCYYNNDSSNGSKYGKLYNGHAVVDSRGLCPSGWRIPSDADWMELANYLGGLEESSLKLRSSDTTGWKWFYDGSVKKYSNGSNSSGFSALPGGGRSMEGYFGDSEYPNEGTWWSSTRINGYSFIYYTLGSMPFRDNGLERSSNNGSPGEGRSVRCVKGITPTKVVNLDNSCPDNFRDITINNISGTARKYKARDGHYYFQVKLNVNPGPTTLKYITKITVKRTQKIENVPVGSIYRSYYINGSSGTFTFDGSFETDYFEIEGTYSCKTGRFGGPSAKIYFRDLKIIQ